jgi:mRNA-degrading endonuclease RelE of RelBE toxin-antitoxin system
MKKNIFKIEDKEKLKREKTIKEYKMREGSYRITVTILEANDLIPHNENFLD